MPDCHEYVHQGGTDGVNFLDNTITTQENKQLTSNMGGSGQRICPPRRY